MLKQIGSSFCRTCFSHGLKMCMWFGFNPAVIFLSLFHFVNFVIFQFSQVRHQLHRSSIYMFSQLLFQIYIASVISDVIIHFIMLMVINLILTTLLHVRDCRDKKQTVLNIKDPGWYPQVLNVLCRHVSVVNYAWIIS